MVEIVDYAYYYKIKNSFVSPFLLYYYTKIKNFDSQLFIF